MLECTVFQCMYCSGQTVGLTIVYMTLTVGWVNLLHFANVEILQATTGSGNIESRLFFKRQGRDKSIAFYYHMRCCFMRAQLTGNKCFFLCSCLYWLVGKLLKQGTHFGVCDTERPRKAWYIGTYTAYADTPTLCRTTLCRTTLRRTTIRRSTYSRTT